MTNVARLPNPLVTCSGHVPKHSWSGIVRSFLVHSGQADFIPSLIYLWFLLMIESFDEENVALVVTIAWSLWSNRNSVRHGGSKKTPKALVQWASHYLIDYAASTVSNAVRPEIV